MNWIAAYYDKDDNLIKTFLIKDRTEHEAEKEAGAEMPKKCHDWSLTKQSDNFFDFM